MGFRVKNRRLYMPLDASRTPANDRPVIPELLRIAIPITLGASIIPITSMLDVKMIFSCMGRYMSEAAVNQRQFVAESVVVDRAGKLVALVYLDADGIKNAGLDEEAISDIPEQVRRGANRHLPPYSQLTKVEVVLQPFEKTPKMSIKRFLYK